MKQNSHILEKLWEQVITIKETHFPMNTLSPILGNGQLYKPKIMFVFINPTIKNISSDPAWPGHRYPFIGTRHVWNIFYRAGMFDSALIEHINKSNWTVDFTENVLDYLQQESFYFTNLVKLTGLNSKLPDSFTINLYLPLLEKEILLIQPQYIVTFGLLPFQALTKQKLRLNDYYQKVMANQRISFYDLNINTETYKLIPCYFPVGRGNPKRAVEILKLVKQLK